MVPEILISIDQPISTERFWLNHMKNQKNVEKIWSYHKCYIPLESSQWAKKHELHRKVNLKSVQSRKTNFHSTNIIRCQFHFALIRSCVDQIWKYLFDERVEGGIRASWGRDLYDLLSKFNFSGRGWEVFERNEVMLMLTLLQKAGYIDVQNSSSQTYDKPSTRVSKVQNDQDVNFLLRPHRGIEGLDSRLLGKEISKFIRWNHTGRFWQWNWTKRLANLLQNNCNYHIWCRSHKAKVFLMVPIKIN